MDEQTQEITSVEWSPEADGPAYNIPEPESEPISEPVELPETFHEDGVALNDDGEVEFGEKFFSEITDTPEPQQPEPVPNYYTPDELRDTPYEQWDISRLHGDIKDFVPIVQEQMRRRQVTQQVMQRPTTPPNISAPQQYTAQELADEAMKLAVQNLGLSDADDFDEYEGTHRAAMNLAMNELTQRRNAEIQQYNRIAGEYQSLQRFNADLSRQPDYAEFDSWYVSKLKEKNLTPQQVDAGLRAYVQRNGMSYGAVQNIISGWYQEFQAEKAARSRPRRQMPPVLESTRGNNYDGGRSVNLRNFGDMDTDQQAEALIRMGLV